MTRLFRFKRPWLSQAAFALSLFALSQSNFGDSATRFLLEISATVYLWFNWIILPALYWWFERKELGETIKNMIIGEESK